MRPPASSSSNEQQIPAAEPPQVPAAEPPLEQEPPRILHEKPHAAGPSAVIRSIQKVVEYQSLHRSLPLLTQVNQVGGVDCPSCAWPDPEPSHRSRFEFCENGAKAIASESTGRRIDRTFFERYSVFELGEQTDRWLNDQGRLCEPMILRPGASHYEPITWEASFRLIADTLLSLQSPDQAIFYTSGRTANETAFLYQLLVRKLGTNNLPDCSNMCHESSGAALTASIGVGKGTVLIDDFNHARLILLIGQNPGTNHPRMLSTLQEAVRHGAELVAINPLKEPGLVGFAHPQQFPGVFDVATPLARTYLQVRINGDQAIFRGIAKTLFEKDRDCPGIALDQDFLRASCTGVEEYRAIVESTDWSVIEELSGIGQAEIVSLADRMASTNKIIACWAMGLTQHHNAVATIRELTNLMLLRGAIGKKGAGLCPVRGHSNVQGDRTMGIWEKMPDSFLDRLGERFHFVPPREHGADSVQAIQMMREGLIHVFVALGGNFLSASPDTHATAEGLRHCQLTVQISTKLNRSHLVTGATALILPCLGRTEKDVQKAGPQFVTVENSMGIVHASAGTATPISSQLLSEPAIIAQVATSVFGSDDAVPWKWLVEDYDRIRDAIADVVPGFEGFNQRIHDPGGFVLDNPARRGKFTTPDGKAHFSLEPVNAATVHGDELLLMTIRSHDQFNTTVYGDDDRYRGIYGSRRVVFLNRDDMAERGLQAKALVNLVGRHGRVASRFWVVPYDIPRGSAAAYFPEANPLVPLDETAEESNTPISKSIPITISPCTAPKDPRL